MKRVALSAALGVTVLALALTVIAVRGDGHQAQAAPAAATTVQVELKEFSATTTPSSVPAGEVQFVVSNTGTMYHELVIIRTDLAPDALPVVGNTVDVSGAGVQVIDTISPFAPGTQQTLTVSLTAGNYVLICNLPGHYQAGIRTAFTVTEATATATSTATATAAPTETATPVATVPPTLTSSPTATPSPAATATPVATATPTSTAKPSASPTPTKTAAPTTATPSAPPTTGAGDLGGDNGLPIAAWAAIGGAVLLMLGAAGVLLVRRRPIGT